MSYVQTKFFIPIITHTICTLESSCIIGEKKKEKEKKMAILNLGAQESDIKSFKFRPAMLQQNPAKIWASARVPLV